MAQKRERDKPARKKKPNWHLAEVAHDDDDGWRDGPPAHGYDSLFLFLKMLKTGRICR